MRSLLADARIETVAGPVVGARFVAGVTTGLNFASAFSSRTVFVAYERLAIGEFATPGGISGLIIQGATGTIGLGARADMQGGGTTNSTVYTPAPGESFSDHVAWADLTEGLSVMRIGRDSGAVLATRTGIIPGTGRANPNTMTLGATSVPFRPKGVIAYDRELTPAERVRVIAWLRQRLSLSLSLSRSGLRRRRAGWALAA